MATIKKAQKGKKVSPTYKNLRMGVKNEQYQMTGQNKDVTPSSKDSARYRGGFEQGMKGMKGMKNEGQVEKMGRWEGQNTKKKGGLRKGGAVKKAQSGVSAGQSALDQYKMMRNTRPATSGNPKASLAPSAQALKMKRMTGMKKGGKISKMSKKK